MNAEIIAIGDELTSGQRLDTNSQWLSQRLGEMGIRVLYHTTVGDDIEANTRVFANAFQRADLIICTGGLGPTDDDLTRLALSRACGEPLETREEALEHIRRIFRKYSRDMPDRNKRQAEFPQGAQMIPNPHGTAPGVDLIIPRDGQLEGGQSPDGQSEGGESRIFALPGVPAEMREMWEQTVRQRIQDGFALASRAIRHRRLKCFGVGESHLEQMLPDMIKRGRVPAVGITVSQATITLRVTAEDASEDACWEAMTPTLQTIRERLGDLVFGEEDEELEHAVASLLAQSDQVLATAEWGTGGLIAHWMSEACRGSQHYVGGAVLRNEQAVGALLGVAAEHWAEHGSHSAELAALLAEKVRDSYGADIGLAVAAIPPAPPRADAPPRVAIALATADETTTKLIPYSGHPDILLTRTAKQALNQVRLLLLKQRAVR